MLLVNGILNSVLTLSFSLYVSRWSHNYEATILAMRALFTVSTISVASLQPFAGVSVYGQKRIFQSALLGIQTGREISSAVVVFFAVSRMTAVVHICLLNI